MEGGRGREGEEGREGKREREMAVPNAGYIVFHQPSTTSSKDTFPGAISTSGL